MMSRLIIGGSKARLDPNYGCGGMYGAYFGSCCECCGDLSVRKYVDSHLILRPSGITADDDDLDMGVLGRLRQSAEADSSATASAAEAGTAATLTAGTPVGDERQFKCPVEGCDESFLNDVNVRSHLRATHGLTPLLQPIAGNTSKSESVILQQTVGGQQLAAQDDRVRPYELSDAMVDSLPASACA
ncbi:MAG: hypothetical protein ACPIOQ_85640, partial [Promethearchaeia archaeon]